MAACAQGADTVIFERLDPGNKLNEELRKVTQEHMEEYGGAGLRTLCLACTELEPADYDACALPSCRGACMCMLCILHPVCRQNKISCPPFWLWEALHLVNFMQACLLLLTCSIHCGPH